MGLFLAKIVLGLTKRSITNGSQGPKYTSGRRITKPASDYLDETFRRLIKTYLITGRYPKKRTRS